MTPPSTITFFSKIPEPRVKVMEITPDGIWVNPDVSVDDTAKSVLSALQIYLGKFIKEAVNREREACAKVCEDLIGTRAMARHCADAIRARGETK
jgi:hypothetical protein